MSENADKAGFVGHISFLKGGIDSIRVKEGEGWKELTAGVSAQLSEALNAKNLAFLLGSGASSLVKDGIQQGIPTMQPLAAEFVGKLAEANPVISPDDQQLLLSRFGIDLGSPTFAKNLERLVEVLYSIRFLLSFSKDNSEDLVEKAVDRCIKSVQDFILKKCTTGNFEEWLGESFVIDIYKNFYRKLVLRDRSLSRPWVFTTNYDVFNERALDQLGMPYCNGFSGVVERRFNPSTFRYSLAEQVDISSPKWTAVEGFVYLCKIHGSVTWIEDGGGLFPIREQQAPTDQDRVMIYPTPAKQNSTLGSPYSDLFREFQHRVAREQSVLVVIGYSFCDEHVNNIIYQALTIPTFRVIIFADPDTSAEIRKLASLNDPRIWIIYGLTPDGNKAHYFESVVKELFPTISGDRIDDAIAVVLERLLNRGSPPTEAQDGSR